MSSNLIHLDAIFKKIDPQSLSGFDLKNAALELPRTIATRAQLDVIACLANLCRVGGGFSQQVSISYLAAESKTSTGTVKRTLRNFSDRGFLAVFEQKVPGKKENDISVRALTPQFTYILAGIHAARKKCKHSSQQVAKYSTALVDYVVDNFEHVGSLCSSDVENALDQFEPEEVISSKSKEIKIKIRPLFSLIKFAQKIASIVKAGGWEALKGIGIAQMRRRKNALINAQAEEKIARVKRAKGFAKKNQQQDINTISEPDNAIPPGFRG